MINFPIRREEESIKALNENRNYYKDLEACQEAAEVRDWFVEQLKYYSAEVSAGGFNAIVVAPMVSYSDTTQFLVLLKADNQTIVNCVVKNGELSQGLSLIPKNKTILEFMKEKVSDYIGNEWIESLCYYLQTDIRKK